MGCGNSSPASSSSSSSSSKGHPDFSSKRQEELTQEDDKRKENRNYGGVYVGLPTDLSSIPQVQIGPLREIEGDSLSLRKPLWGNGL
ncbi:overexpressed in colon carcinoma 1 protein homolog isoform X1 [Melanotaenia boesemani]|uniref:overexpressed in colon carcinoma 1 protein homolog isoform X1 n=1 Tax=Melanotaenia boesemani TaxID=1250792 RepID=UPI001C0524F4|nr:overexpressed in colon carcinoma 1 protein homolog isoform X1 [Melanotaenia boesemani]